MWVKNTICNTWRETEVVFISKVEGATEVEKFLTMSLLNVEGKLYFFTGVREDTKLCPGKQI